jgi:tRNA threonylcarbamoyladenosine modification (KEOPS) complex  Pcc1 subunit
MSLQSVFTIPDADSSFEKLFAPELADILVSYDSKRAIVSFKRNKNNTIITVDAHDAIALRAMVNGITKVLSIKQKMDDI